MADDNTATLTDSPPQSPDESLTAAAARPPAPLEAQPKPDEAVTQSEGDDGGAKPEEKETPVRPWAEVETTEALLEHEAVAPLISERLDAARDEARKQGLSDAQSRMQPLLDRNQGTLDRIDAGVQKFVSAFNRLVRTKDGEGTPVVAKSQIEELLEDHKETFAALAGTDRELGKWAGGNGLIKGLATALSSQEFGTEFHGRLDQMQRGLNDEHLYADIVKAISDEATKPLKVEIKELKAKVESVKVEHRSAERDGTKPPADVSGTGGGGPITRAALKAMPQDQVNALSDEQVKQALAGS